MRPRFWVAYGALAVALALLVPTLAPLSGSMDSFAKNLADGEFRPFGPKGPRPQGKEFSGSLGGFTGDSPGNYLPGAAEVPSQWVMDRDGRGGHVVIDAVFNPSLGAMKRLKAFDKIGEDGVTLSVADSRLRPYAVDATVRYDTPIDGSFDVRLRAGEMIPIYSPHPRPLIRTFSTYPPVAGGVQFFLDGADTLHVRAAVDANVTLNVSFMTELAYYDLDVPLGASVAQYPASVRPVVPPQLVEDAKVVLARAGAGDGSDLGLTLDALARYFRSFTEGDIPPPTEVESLYLALALGGNGCCRHRAFAFMVTAQAIGIPTRVVVNEAHAFAEVLLPIGAWHQINLGGCGTYSVNNPNNHRDLLDQAHDPRGEANPDEDRPRPTVPTFTNITESPTRIVKGERYLVNGTVEAPGGRPVPGARIDVFLNETKDTPGRLTGAGVTDSRGHFSVIARVPRDLPARSYQLVARALDPGAGEVLYLESWSDPEVEVFAPTRFILPSITTAAGHATTIAGRLVDVDGNAVPRANLSWRLAGSDQGFLSTDQLGRFSTQATFEDVSTPVVEFAFAGTQHHGPAFASLEIRVLQGAIILPPEAPTLPRGETTTVNATVALAGQAVAGREIRVTITDGPGGRILASATGITNERGGILVPLEIPKETPAGVFPLIFDAPSLRLNAVGSGRVAIRPTLEIEAPTTVSPGDDWQLKARLVSDNGTPVAGGIVEVTIDANRTATRALLTNRTGYARFEFPPRALDVGGHVVEIRFPGNEDHADTSVTTRVELVRPWIATVPAWVYAAALSALAVVALAAWSFRPGGPMHVLLLRVRKSHATRRTIEATFPDHPAGVPAVFEPGELASIRLHVRHRDGRIVTGRLVADVANERKKGRAKNEGWTLQVQAPADGPLTLRVRASGPARFWTFPLTLEIPVHTYRQAVERGFVALRERANLPAAATPGDVVRTIGPRLPSAHQAKLRAAAALFEVADYSERPVDRAFYHSFAAAVRDVERILTPEATPRA